MNIKRASNLWQDVGQTVCDYPDGVVAVPEPVSGTAFFPGGLGLWMGDNSITDVPKPIMIVGQDFNSVRTYQRIRAKGSEVGTSPTWRNLLTILGAANISPDSCFFTNVYMGLRSSGPETGLFPGSRDSTFVNQCMWSLAKQIEMVRPQVIVTLGLEPLRVLAKRFFDFQPPKRISDCDQIYAALRLPHGPVSLVALTHPSLYYSNVRRRRYAGSTGVQAEVLMLKSVLTATARSAVDA